MGITLGLMVLAILVAVALQVDDWSRDLTTNRAATSQDAADPLLRSLEVAASAEEIEEAIAQFVDRSVAWTGNSNPKSTSPIFLIRTSRLFHFADDVQVFLQPTATGTRIDIASKSRVGKGDLGQNPRNVRELMRMLRTEVK